MDKETVDSTEGNKAANEENKSANEENKATNAENKAANEENKAANEENKSANGDNKSANEENKAANEENKSANEENKATNEENKSANEEKKAENEENNSANEENKATNEENKVANEENKAANEENKSANGDNKSAHEEIKAAYEENKSANEENKAANEENKAANDRVSNEESFENEAGNRSPHLDLPPRLPSRFDGFNVQLDLNFAIRNIMQYYDFDEDLTLSLMPRVTRKRKLLYPQLDPLHMMCLHHRVYFSEKHPASPALTTRTLPACLRSKAHLLCLDPYPDRQSFLYDRVPCNPVRLRKASIRKPIEIKL